MSQNEHPEGPPALGTPDLSFQKRHIMSDFDIDHIGELLTRGVKVRWACWTVGLAQVWTIK